MRVSLDRAMVLRQPWAQAVVEGAFPALIRTQPTNIRGWVGVLAAKNPDPVGFTVEGQDLPRGAIVGAVELVGCVTLEGSAREFLQDRFGSQLAEFYPDHFIPDTTEKHVWVLHRALRADRIREWQETIPRTWARCNTWIEGEPVQLLERTLSARL